MSTYGYVRVSTKLQAEDGQSLPVQERQLTGYAMMIGLTVDQTFVEAGVSGSVPLQDRPQGLALLSILKAGDVVIACKLDRMFRSARDALNVVDDLKARGVALHLIDLGGDVCSNGISKLFFTILSAVAEAERDRIRERISTVKADQRQRGRYLGGKVPFGYRVELDPIDPANPTKKRGGTLIEIPEQQAAMATARRLRSSGVKLHAVREALIADHGVTLGIATLHGMLA